MEMSGFEPLTPCVQSRCPTTHKPLNGCFGDPKNRPVPLRRHPF